MKAYTSIEKANRTSSKALKDYYTNKYRVDNSLFKDSNTLLYVSSWLAVIDSVLCMLRETDPAKAEVLIRLFGIDKKRSKYIKQQARIVKLCMELHISQATLYNWRAEGVLMVTMGAIQAGLLTPISVPLDTPGTLMQALADTDRALIDAEYQNILLQLEVDKYAV